MEQTKLDFDTEDYQPMSIGMAKLTSPIVFIYDGDIEGIETKFSVTGTDGVASKLMYSATGKLGKNLVYLGKTLKMGTPVQLLFNSTALYKSFVEHGEAMSGIAVEITGREAGVDRRYHIEAV